MKNTHDEMIEVIQAHKEGKEIEYRYIPSDDKWYISSNPSWDFSSIIYRVKQKEIEAWGVVCGGELSRICHDKILAEEWAGSKDTVIRLIPDPNYKG